MSLPLEAKAKQIRRRVVEVIRQATSHLGGCFSCVEILTTLFYREHVKRGDFFLMGKGHANLTLMAIAEDLGWITPEQLNSFGQNDAIIGGQLDHRVIPWWPYCSGSIGHVLGIMTGVAMAEQLRGNPTMRYVLLGDGECQEGAIWEAANFASRMALSNITAIIDANSLSVSQIVHEPFVQRFTAFGWWATEVDGHNIEALHEAFTFQTEVPKCIVARTVKGKGVPFLEGMPSSHHGHFSPEQLAAIAQALI